ncbi:lysosome membrane protein 2-like [Orbicella faveolata]|uniref:lysosome membrane protein 2-like n=1 Tax=Orbicella faveolata TaxID=48498 RepID=UPI0009E60F14|nr:lysosome membrane protein 2-like [Orbicella faveolata]
MLSEGRTKKKRDCCRARTKICLLVTSGIFLLVLGTVCFTQANKWIQSIINSQLVIKPSSALYEQWRSPTVPVRMQFYMFNVENPLEVKQGGHPYVSQKGPYCYRVHQTKKNITWNNNYTVSYNKFTKYVFDTDCSCSSCDPYTNTVTLPNVPLVILSEVSKTYPGSSMIFSIIFERFKEEFFKITTVDELLWGYQDPVFEFFAEIKRKYHLSFLPDIDPIFRMMDNNSLDGVVTTYTGASDISRAAVWTEWKGKPNVGLWNSSWANMLNGSDGMQFPPQTSTDDTLYAFYVQLCKSMRFVYGSQTTVHGVDTLRFTYPEELWQNASVNPANRGFCPNGCFPSGILDASVCKDTPVAVPAIVASEPHFYQGDPSLVSNVGGLDPIKEEHGTFFDIEPHFGLPLHLSLRLQLNVNIKPTKYILQMAGVKEVILPIVYLNNSVSVDASTANTMKQVLTAMKAVPWVSGTLICIGTIELVIAFCWILKRLKERSHVNDERTPLIANGESTRT